MKNRLTIKNHHFEIALYKRRMVVCAVLIVAFTAVLVTRLAYLQIVQHQFYSTLSDENFMTVVPVEPNRGLIYDRNGVLLVNNVPAFNLTMDPSRVSNVNQTIKNLQGIINISDDDINAFQRQRKQVSAHQPVVLKPKLTEDEVARFYVNQYFFPGVTIQAQMIRTYPMGGLFVHVIGYVGRINTQDLTRIDTANYSGAEYIGKMGIEAQYENLLRGYLGSQEVETDANGRTLRVLKEHKPVSGQDIYLTIDSRLQQAASDALGTESGSIVVMNPQNGEILAMVSKPTYDPDPFVTGISHDDYQQLLTAPDQPLYDRAMRGVFPPGSTVKPFYAIEALDTGVITTDYKIVDHGIFMLPGNPHVYHNHGWKKGGQGVVDVVRAIIVSCDTFFYNVAVRMGINGQDATLTAFGFGKPTGIDMPHELSGLVGSPAWKRKIKGDAWYLGDTVVMGIGQGFLLVTPLQLVQGVSIIANHGILHQPHLLMKAMQNNIVTLQPTYLGKQQVTLKNPPYWDYIISAMQQVVMKPGGTAYNGFGGANVPYTIAGKTGTAQVVGREGGEDEDENTPKAQRNNHMFIAFAPIDKPEVAIVVLYEHNIGAPKLARQVLDVYFQNKPQVAKTATILLPQPPGNN